MSPIRSTSSTDYKAVNPARVLDTRSGNGAPKVKIGSGQTIDLAITGRGGVPSNDIKTVVSAVVLNVTTVNATQGSYLTVYPTGGSRPVVSNVNFTPGSVVANLVVVKTGTAGKVSIYNAAGAVDVIADVQGYYGVGGSFVGVAPVRLLDTRSGLGAARAGAAGSGAVVSLRVLGVGGVPPTGVSAVVLNVTAVTPSSGGYLTVYPGGTTRPTSSSLNFPAGAVVASSVHAQVGTDGTVAIFNSVGRTHVLADVDGYYTAAGGYVPIAPKRLLDTRGGVGALGASQAVDLQVTGSNGLPVVGATTVALTLTAVNPTKGGYLTVYPYGAQLPTASNVNFAAGRTTANFVLAKVGAGGWISVYNAAGSVEVAVDAVGYFTTAAKPILYPSENHVASIDIAGMPARASGSDCIVAASTTGRYVLFTSPAPSMVPRWNGIAVGDGGGVFVRDMVLGITTAVVLPAPGTTACSLGLSPDGAWALWTSTQAYADDDTNLARDVYQTNLLDGRTRLVSRRPDHHAGANAASTSASQSDNGTWVAFQSTGSNLTDDDTNGSEQDVFLANLTEGILTRIGPGSITPKAVSDGGAVAYTATGVPDSPGPTRTVLHWDRGVSTPVAVSQTGTLSTEASYDAYLSANGTVVIFTSPDRLAISDQNDVPDAFKRDLTTNLTGHVSRTSAGGSSDGGNGSAAGPTTETGATVLFSSTQTNLYQAGYTLPPGSGAQLFKEGPTGIQLVSISPLWHPADGPIGPAAYTRNGFVVTFETSAPNMTGTTETLAFVRNTWLVNR